MKRLACKPFLAAAIRRGVKTETRRVQEIAEAQAAAEGVEEMSHGWRDYLQRDIQLGDARWSFSSLWDSIHGKEAPWESNPWVWRYAFELAEDFPLCADVGGGPSRRCGIVAPGPLRADNDASTGAGGFPLNAECGRRKAEEGRGR